VSSDKRLFWISKCPDCVRGRLVKGYSIVDHRLTKWCNTCDGTGEIREEVKVPTDDGEPIEIRFYVCRTFDTHVHFLKQEGTFKQWVMDWKRATAWRSAEEAKSSAAVSFDCVIEMTDRRLCAALGV
jgi:hypothetical protein